MKRIAGFIFASVMAMSLAVPTMAADITIDGTGTDYQAYRILDLTTSLKVENDEHGAGGHNSDCYNYAYTVNDKYINVLKNALPNDSSTANNDGYASWDMNKDGEASEREIIDYISGLGDNSEGIREYADEVYSGIKNGSLAADATSTEKVFSSVAQGYYLILESTLSDDPDSRSLVMLNTAGQDDITVHSKEDVPTITKKVQEVNDSDSTGTGVFQDGADADIDDDDVKFKIEGTFPSNIDAYDSYKYVIHDTINAAFSIKADNIVVKLDGVTLVKGTDYTVNTSSGHCSMEITIDDAVALAADKLDGRELTNTTKLTVEYDATLGSTADIGNTGNDNTVYLEFSNDPYDLQSTSNTTVDRVNVFTYKFTVNKVDSEGTPLDGAGFKLQKWNGTEYEDYDTESGVKAEDKTTFVFNGLDGGRYKLVETDVPDGYNRADDLEFVVSGVYPAESDNSQLTAINVTDVEGEPIEGFSVNYNEGTLTISIKNTSGVQLPSTGGDGLYVTYIIGAVVIACGIAAFIPKKKENKNK